MLENDEVVVGIELTDLKAEMPAKHNKYSVTAIKKFQQIRNHSNSIQAFINTKLIYQDNIRQRHGFGTMKKRA